MTLSLNSAQETYPSTRVLQSSCVPRTVLNKTLLRFEKGQMLPSTLLQTLVGRQSSSPVKPVICDLRRGMCFAVWLFLDL